MEVIITGDTSAAIAHAVDAFRACGHRVYGALPCDLSSFGGAAADAVVFIADGSATSLPMVLDTVDAWPLPVVVWTRTRMAHTGLLLHPTVADVVGPVADPVDTIGTRLLLYRKARRHMGQTRIFISRFRFDIGAHVLRDQQNGERDVYLSPHETLMLEHITFVALRESTGAAPTPTVSLTDLASALIIRGCYDDVSYIASQGARVEAVAGRVRKTYCQLRRKLNDGSGEEILSGDLRKGVFIPTLFIHEEWKPYPQS